MRQSEIGDLVSTREDLDRLSTGTVVVNKGEYVFQRLPSGCWLSPDAGVHLASAEVISAGVPLTVIFVRGHASRNESVIAAEAITQAADAWQTGGWADIPPPPGSSRPALILGMAQRTVDWLRMRASETLRGID